MRMKRIVDIRGAGGLLPDGVYFTAKPFRCHYGRGQTATIEDILEKRTSPPLGKNLPHPGSVLPELSKDTPVWVVRVDRGIPEAPFREDLWFVTAEEGKRLVGNEEED